ncbi:MAG: molybdopterin molybdotransferase MoeA [Sulfurovaceae bacterium]|jgi:molybdopterin molybdotransferase|nr:molybdopterin molybdotransferase MoeA [Sulfurovaceae bacterium]
MAVSILEALEIIYKNTIPITKQESIATEESIGRICATDIYARIPLPRFDHSAMDGYAIRISNAGQSIECQDILYAGSRVIPALKEDYAIRIMTGAPVPMGCEAIVPLENVVVNNDMVTLPGNIKHGSHIRRQGEELKTGTICLHQGEEITPYAIGLLASQGIDTIEVICRPNVTILSTGDELKPYTQKNIEEFEIYNSNTPMFAARAKSIGCQTESLNICSDDLQTLKIHIKASLDCDVILTSGGASVGDKDITKLAFFELGMEMLFEKIDIKPGKPTSLGKIGDTLILILPGNPLAAMVNFELFAVPILEKLKGAAKHYHTTIQTALNDEFRLKSGKYSVILGQYDGKFFHPLLSQAPNQVSILKDANSLMITTPDIEYIEKNKIIKIIPIGFIMSYIEEENIFVL